jgi:hypothetical protein
MTMVRDWVPFELGIEEPDDDVVGDDDNRPPSRVPRGVRKRRLLALPLALVLLGAGAKILAMTWYAKQGSASYESGAYETSRDQFARLRLLNVVDPWKAWFDLGDARFRLGDLIGAEAAFSRALSADPSQCAARFNLAVTIEAQGDRLMGDNVRDVTESEELDGLARYRVALDIVNSATCEVDGTGSPGYRLAETRRRLEEKLGADQSPQSNAQPDDPDDDEPRERDESQANQTLQDQIEQRNNEGEAERQDASDINPTANQEPQDPNW